MPETPEVDTQQLEQWFDTNVVLLLVIAVLLLVLYAYSARIVHAAVSRALSAQKGQVGPGSPEAVELDKRAATLSSLVTAILRIVVAGVVVTLVIGFFGLWGVLAGAGLLLAALTLAGQSIVLDYLMGILIILEGQYFKGDVIAVGAVAGTVEDVGLRRTTVRSADGTVHSISNGEIRIVSNRTRVFAAAEVTIPGIREQDFERVLEIMDRVGREVAQDPRFTASVIETPSVAFIGDPDDLGMTATMRGKVVAGERWTIATEIRRRLNRAFVDAGVVLNKRGVVPRERRGLDESALYVPEAGDD
jgi:moderate conductance mechanosensitive channel